MNCGYFAVACIGLNFRVFPLKFMVVAAEENVVDKLVVCGRQILREQRKTLQIHGGKRVILLFARTELRMNSYFQPL